MSSLQPYLSVLDPAKLLGPRMGRCRGLYDLRGGSEEATPGRRGSLLCCQKNHPRADLIPTNREWGMKVLIKLMMSKLHSQDYLMRDWVDRGLWKPCISLCKVAIKYREDDIKTLKEIQKAIQEKLWEDEE